MANTTKGFRVARGFGFRFIEFPEVVEEAIGEKIEVPASVQFLLDKAKVSIPLAANYTAFKHWMMQN